MLRCGLAFLICYLCAWTANAGEVHIAEVLRVDLERNRYVEVRAGSYRALPITVKMPGRLEVTITVHNEHFPDINAWVCDQTGYDAVIANLSPGRRCRGMNRAVGQFQFDYQIERTGPHYLVIDNSFSLLLKKRVTASVAINGVLPEKVRRDIEIKFGEFLNNIQQRFRELDFDLAVAPCGQVNAFSGRNGNIVMCSELLFGFMLDGVPGAVEAVFWHEFAHSALNLWGLPNFDNEETADELALVMLLWTGREGSASDWIASYSGDDPRSQAEHIIRHGGRHPLSVQRVRNIERILADPKPVVARWNRLLYPRLTDQTLREVIADPGRYHDPDMARAELADR